MLPELVIFVGLPGAGKSRFYRAHFAATHALVSKDAMPGGDKNKRQQRLVRAHLGAGENVVVDNTNASRAEREALFPIARECGARVTGYYFEVDSTRCHARNQTREGKARVPDIAIWATLDRLQVPAWNEGFHALLRVRLAPNGAPVIWPWSDNG